VHEHITPQNSGVIACEVRPEGIEPPTSWFEARRSVRLSYGRTWRRLKNLIPAEYATIPWSAMTVQGVEGVGWNCAQSNRACIGEWTSPNTFIETYPW
jgi:hypothetical protein